MKKYFKIIAMLLAATLLASCTASASSGVPVDASVEDMLGFEREEQEKTCELTVDSRLMYSSYTENGDEIALTAPLVIDLRIPEGWTALGENVYQRITDENNCAALCMKAPSIYKKFEDFKLDETVHAALNPKGIRADLSGWDVCAYKTAGGYDSIIYYNHDEDSQTFNMYAYLELDESYVVGVNMYDRAELGAQMLDILDTFSFDEYDPIESYSGREQEFALRSYMNSLVTYFHEPYMIGDDISDINVIYLCFSYANANKALYYDIGYDLERQTITVPQKRMEEICEGLLGEEVNIVSYEEKYLFENKNTADGKYGGVDGVGYIINYATDYWQGDLWHLDHEKYDDPLEITEDGDNIKVKAHIYYGMMGEYESPRTLEYTFERVISEDAMHNHHLYFRLVEITE